MLNRPFVPPTPSALVEPARHRTALNGYTGAFCSMPEGIFFRERRYLPPMPRGMGSICCRIGHDPGGGWRAGVETTKTASHVANPRQFLPNWWLCVAGPREMATFSSLDVPSRVLDGDQLRRPSTRMPYHLALVLLLADSRLLAPCPAHRR